MRQAKAAAARSKARIARDTAQVTAAAVVPVVVPPPVPSTIAKRKGSTLDRALKVFTLVGKKPRPVQIEAMEKCIANYEQGAKFVVLEAPPGIGKSLIGAALASVYGRTYFTTLTAQLQEQYMEEFSKPLGMRALKGRGKYECSRAGESCLIGRELFNEDSACHGPNDPLDKSPALPVGDDAACPYLYGKQAAFNSPYMMANYHSFLANIGQAQVYGDQSGGDDDLDALEGDALLAEMARRTAAAQEEPTVVRPFMVLDEAHVIEGFLLDQTGISVNLLKLGVRTPPLPQTEDVLAPYIAWMNDVLPLLKQREKVLSDAQEKQELRSLVRRMGLVLAKAAKGDSDYIVERDRDSNRDLKPNWFAVKPLRVHEYGHWLWGYGKRALFMSATVLDCGQLCTNIGLPLKDGDFVQMGSVFPKENRPIDVTPLDMRMSNRDFSWPRVAQLVDHLLTHHSREKGLLLCPSNEMLKYISTSPNLSSANRMRLIFAYGKERETKYKEHLASSNPTVLAASGYWEGADLAGNASRFQIVPALPRPMWHGQIKARAKIDPAWYRWLTFTKAIQGLGRSVRSDTDEAITYLFDKEFVDEMRRPHGSMVPPWVTEAVRVRGEQS